MATPQMLATVEYAAPVLAVAGGALLLAAAMARAADELGMVGTLVILVPEAEMEGTETGREGESDEESDGEEGSEEGKADIEAELEIAPPVHNLVQELR